MDDTRCTWNGVSGGDRLLKKSAKVSRRSCKTLETAYVNKDAPAIHELLLPLEQLEILEAEARQDFAQFSTIQLDLNINRIIVDGDRISAFISWQGKWQRSIQEPGDQAIVGTR